MNSYYFYWKTTYWLQKSDPYSAVNFHEKSYITVHFFKISKFMQFSMKIPNFSSKTGQFGANFTRKLAFYHNFLPLQCKFNAVLWFPTFQCISWTMKNLPLMAARLVIHWSWLNLPWDMDSSIFKISTQLRN